MFYPINTPTNPRFSHPPPALPPMMMQFQQPTQQQQPGYWIYCPPTVAPFTGSNPPYASFSNDRVLKPTSPTLRDQSKKENKLAQVYKTELCRQFTDYGRCNYGTKCGYAHGVEELRSPPPRAPKFRTEICAVFGRLGQCPNGDRCHFVHDNSSLSLTSKVSSVPQSFGMSTSFGSPSSSGTSSPAAQFDFHNDLSLWPSVHSLAANDYSPIYNHKMAN